MNGRFKSQLTGYAFVLPWLIALSVFIAYPFFAGLWFSFCDYPPLKEPMYIGAANYQELVVDPAFGRSLGVTMVYAAVAIPLGVIVALTLAMLLNARIRGQSFYRVIYYLPHLVPTVAVAILWLWIFNPQIGLLNLILKPLMNAGDWWSGLFFDLQSAAAGNSFFTAASAALLAGPVVVAYGSYRSYKSHKTNVKQSPQHPILRFLRSLSVLATILAVVAIIHAELYRLIPQDMVKWHSPGWLTDGTPMPSNIAMAPSWALWALIVMSLWGVGQMAVIYLAKLQDVPQELYEAAEIDGATWWSKTLHVTIPMISPVILFNVVMAIIGTFQIFAEPYIMTQGGPEDKTRFVAMFVYDEAFRYHRLGYASAIAWVLFLLIVILTIVTFRLSRKHVHYVGK